MVKRQTSETADFFGFNDRGRLKPGKRADINVIDFDRLRLHAPEVVNDLPTGGKRLVQRAEGYEATLVAGTRSSNAASPPAPNPEGSCAVGGSASAAPPERFRRPRCRSRQRSCVVCCVTHDNALSVFTG
jgi:N-acyl-D-aspartate/D-glutamate deacylase